MTLGNNDVIDYMNSQNLMVDINGVSLTKSFVCDTEPDFFKAYCLM